MVAGRPYNKTPGDVIDVWIPTRRALPDCWTKICEAPAGVDTSAKAPSMVVAARAIGPNRGILTGIVTALSAYR